MKRSRANEFAFTLREEGCADQIYNYHSKSFRGWAFDNKNFVYSVSYSECQKPETNFENIPLIDVVYLKDGRILKGIIVEQVPGLSIKIQVGDGSTLVFKVSEIVRMTRE